MKTNKEIIEEFREKFGGDIWLGADRELVETFLIKALASQRAEIVKIGNGLRKTEADFLEIGGVVIDKELIRDTLKEGYNLALIDYQKAIRNL